MTRAGGALVALSAILGLAACATSGAPTVPPSIGSAAPTVGVSVAPTVPATLEVTSMPSSGPFTLTSDAFAEGGAIPREYSCQGTDISPTLAWSGTPTGTAELVLVVDDPDAGGFVHWIALIDGTEVALPRAISSTARTPQQGTNSFGDVGWSGPCPPSGAHHYRFTLTALAAATGLAGNPTIAEVRGALAKATVLGTAVLTGTYRKT
jgi:Raf kinase inhibitor-like YbhB/YbcL family protein